MRRTLLLGLLLLALLGGCRKKQTPTAPPVTLPPPIQPRQTPVVEAPKVQPQTPSVPQQAPPEEIVPTEPEEIAPPPAPAKQPARKARTPRRNQPAAPAPPAVPEEKTETPPPAKPPQLGELLDEEQRELYQQQYAASLASARAALAAIEGRNLSPAQADAAARVRGFIQEAEKMKASDIRTAAQLALRASSLGRDLQNSLK